MKNEKYIIDSSVFLAFLLQEGKHYEDSKQFLERLFRAGSEVVLPFLVLFEVFHTLKRNRFFQAENARDKFEDFFDYKFFKYIDLNDEFLELFQEIDFFVQLKTSDAIVASTAVLADAILITWDENLIRNSINSYTPSEFLEKFA